MSQIYGIKGLGDWSHPDARPKSYDEVMFKYQPEMAPLTGLTTKLGEDTATDMEFTMFEEDIPVSQVLVSGSHDNAVTTIVLKTTGDAGATPAKVLREGDVLRCPRTGEVFWVAAEPASPWTSIVVATRATLGGTAYALVDGDTLEIMSGAAAEGSDAGEALSDTPSTVQNYLQDIEEVCEVSDWAEETEFRPAQEKAYAREKRRALERFKLKWEKTLLWGLKKSTTKAGKLVYFTGGIASHITTNVFDDSSTGTSMDRVMEVFATLRSRGQGSETKWGFAGTTALRYLTNLIRKETVANWSVGEMLDRRATYGLRVFEIEGPTMRLQLIHTPILALNSTDSAKVVIIDPKYIRRVRKVGKIGPVHFDDDITKDNGYRGRKGRWRAVQGLKLTCQKVHGIWTVGAYAP